MAINLPVTLIEQQAWPQGDKRDPLGIWGARLGVTGDATGGGIKVTATVEESKRDAYVYTCYGITAAKLTGNLTADVIKTRLLTNWPNVDPLAGIQGFASLTMGQAIGDTSGTAPLQGSNLPTIRPEMRFILLFARTGTPLGIVEVEWNNNLDAATYSFEFWGYFWDRSVLQAPGGPRHPGSA